MRFLLKNYRLLFVCCLGILPVHSNAQSLTFEYLTPENGLSHTSVTSIVQDKTGFLWFGTMNGLNRYDGHTFIKYYSDQSDHSTIGGDRIEDLLIDHNGYVWVAHNNGFSKYNPYTGAFTNYDKEHYHTVGFSGGIVTCLLEDQFGKIWVGTTEDGVYVLEPGNEGFEHFESVRDDSAALAGNNVRCLLSDALGNIWIGTDSEGLSIFDVAKQQFRNYRFEPGNPTSLPSNSIYAMQLDEEGNVWMGTYGKGLVKAKMDEAGMLDFQCYNPETTDERRLHVLSLDIWNKKILIGTENGGLDIFDIPKNSFENINYNENRPSSISGNSIHAIFEDSSNNIWIGTYSAGLNVYKADKKPISTYRKIASNNRSLSSNMVAGFYEDASGNVWVGTDGGGVNYWNRSNHTFTSYNKNNSPIFSSSILSITADSSGTIWMGGWDSGLIRYHPDEGFKNYSEIIQTPTNIIMDILVDLEGQMWIVFGGVGLGMFNPGNLQLILYTPDNSILENPWIFDLDMNHNGELLLATTNGFDIFNPKSNTYRHFSNDTGDITSISHNLTHVIHVAKDSTLWIGTVNGLNHYLPEDDMFRRYYVKHGLANNNISGIEEDENGNIWISTADGLSNLDVSSNTFHNFNFIDGLQGQNFLPKSVARLSSGELLFGGTNGFSIFHPDSIQYNTFQPPVVITGFSIFNEPANVGDPGSPLDVEISQAQEIQLTYQESVFSFEFAALDFLAPGQNQYAYKLEPFDQQWNYVGGQRSATYTSIEPGSYTFRVKATNNDGLWSPYQAEMQLNILPPWWLTLWFRIAITLVLLGFIFSMHQFRLNLLRKQKLKLEETVKKRTNEIYDMNKEIETQNEELRSQAEQLALQNDQLEQLNFNVNKQKDKIANINQSLEVKIAERTVQLNRTIDELNKTIAELDRFVYSASHDLSAPLKSIRGLLNLTKYDSIDTNAKEKLEYISGSIDQLEKVIKSLTEFSRNTRMDLVLGEVNLKEEIEDCYRELKYLGEQSKLGFLVEIPENFSILTDKMRLRVIVNNLLSNALKYQDEIKNENYIKIKASEGDENIEISIEDNGIGIEEEYIDHVFDMFFRATEMSNGSGLGLYITKETIKKLGGEIFVASKISEGTRFKISLPRKYQTEG